MSKRNAAVTELLIKRVCSALLETPTSLFLLKTMNLLMVLVRMRLVRERGLEPPRLAALPPQGSASTNSATRA